MRRSVVAMVVALAVAGGLSPLPSAAPAAAAAAGTTLPFTYFADLVADPVDDLAYVAGGGGDGQVAVVDRSGALVRTYDGLSYPTGIALSEDRRTLYVAEGQSSLIVAIDLGSGTRRLYPLDGACGQALVVVGGKVWFSTCDNTTVAGPMGVLDVSTGAVTTGLGPEGSNDFPRLAVDPQDPDTLFTLAHDRVFRLDITPTPAGEPQARVSASRLFDNGGSDLRVSPDGTRVITTDGVFRAVDLALVDRYPAEKPFAVAVRADDTVAIGGRSVYGYDRYVYAPGRTTFAERTDFGVPYKDRDEFVEPRGLAFSSTTLFTVTSPSVGFTHPAPVVVYASEPDPPDDPIGSTRLAMPAADGVVNDAGHHQSFVGTGVGGNGIVVVDDRGRVTHVVQHLPDIARMTVSGNTLWAAVGGLHAIAAIDTRTYAVRLYPLPVDDDPVGIAVVRGLVFFSARAGSANDYIAALDPATGMVTKVVDPAGPSYLASSPGFPGRLYAYSTFDAPDRAGATVRYSVAGGTQPALRVVTRRYLASSVDDAAITRNLDYLVYAAPYGNNTGTVARSDNLTPIGPQRKPISASSVAVRADGLTAIGYGSDSYTAAPYDLFVRWGALGRPVKTVDFTGAQAVPRGVAFAGRDLLAVTRGAADGEYDVRVVRMPALRR